MTLSFISSLHRTGPAADEVQPIFITVDPERDTPEHLAEYVPLFHPRLVGLTGDPAAIAEAARSYKVFGSTPSITLGSST